MEIEQFLRTPKQLSQEIISEEEMNLYNSVNRIDL